MRLFHERIADYAAAFPGKAAVTDPRGEISYGELEKRSAQISRVLAALGVRAGDAVAVYVPYGKEILTGAVSALRAGAVFVPFDFEYPVERLMYMQADSETKAILTLRSLWEKKPLRFPADKVLFMDEAPAREQKEPCCAALSEESPAMLLYTSGTTGKPKGVLHAHRMLLHLVDWINIHADAAMDADTRSGVITSFSFVGTQMFLLGPLSKGGTVCIAPEMARKDLGALHQFLRDKRVTHIFLPSGLAAIMAEDYDISGVFIFAAGEKLRSFRPLVPGSFLIDSYGSTETSGVLSKKVYGDESRILVGKPYVNTKARIADEALKTVPPGEAGELLISNAFMSRQYWKQPDLSAEKWIELDSETWFRTGDRGVLTAEGDYELLGRIDNMVKLRGFRIETGEVEAQIADAAARLGRSDVRQVAVVVKTVAGIENLVCYYEAPRDLDSLAVSDEIAKTLTDYMIPKIWVRMDALPRNLNGKVLRGELPQPERDRNMVNRELCVSNPGNMFATVFALTLHPETGIVSYANAGHEAPLLLRKEPSYMKVNSGIALGLFEDSDISEEKLVLFDGDGILLYTDGITEALSADKQQYGKERLRKTVSRKYREEARFHDARALVGDTVASVRAYTSGVEQFDDITCLALLCKDSEGERQRLAPELKAFEAIKSAILSSLGESDHTKNIILACEEIFVNIVNYAGTDEIIFRSKRSGSTWMATYEDNGVAFDPVKVERKCARFEELDQGGMGILVARMHTRDMIYSRIDGWNVLTMVFDA